VARYIRVSPARVAGLLARKAAEGAAVCSELSPYDAPNAIVGSFDSEIAKFWIAFEYLDDEPASQIARDEAIDVFAGKNSRKLRRLSILIEQLPLDLVAIDRWKTRVVGLLNQVVTREKIAKTTPINHRLDWDVAIRLLDEEFAELTSELTTRGDCICVER
jgi:hypothetical protein